MCPQNSVKFLVIGLIEDIQRKMHIKASYLNLCINLFNGGLKLIFYPTESFIVINIS